MIFSIVAFCTSLVLYPILWTQKHLSLLFTKAQSINKWNTTNRPQLGGIGLYILVCISVIAGYILKKPIIPNDLYIILSLSFFVGIIDDIYGIDGKIKLVIYSCLMMSYMLFQSNFSLSIDTLTIAVFTIISISSLNILDHADGILTSTTIGIFIGFIVLSNTTILPIYYILFGGLCAFLIYNLNNNIFLGESGCNIISFPIAFYIIKTVLENTQSNVFGITLQYYSILLIPLLDILHVSYYRLSAQKSVFEGGTDHISHTLMKKWHLSSSTISLSIIIFSIIHTFFVKIIFTFDCEKYVMLAYLSLLAILFFIIKSNRTI